jgi:His-Xaa-Ser system radical SAM maturase HxsB
MRTPGRALISNDLGEFCIVDNTVLDDLVSGSLSQDHPRRRDLEARGLLSPEGPSGTLADAARRTRKSFLFEGPSLHILVTTLRCDHTCDYCQVSRAAEGARGYDMSLAHANAALDRIFESDSPHLTIEFQGGEPALRFDLIRHIVTAAEEQAAFLQRSLRFTMATTLQRLSDDDLEFCRQHDIHLSTSIDGPADLHDRHRKRPRGGSWAATIAALDRARSVLGNDGVVALPTLTPTALRNPEAVVDAYVDLGFRSIFLRPSMPYGFGRRIARNTVACVSEFLDYYARALEHIIALNAEGVPIEETTASILLQHILTGRHSGYMDLRSPTSAGLGVLVYNYDGRVYPSDEARMAARVGDYRFVLGSVETPLAQLLAAPAMQWLARGAIAESLSDCGQCAFVPYCGADPVFHAIAQGEPDAPRHGSDHCERWMGILEILFAHLNEATPDTLRTFQAWAFKRQRDHVRSNWIPS